MTGNVIQRVRALRDRMPKRAMWARRAAAILALLHAGCGIIGLDDTPVVGQCTVDSDCGAGLRCYGKHVCIANQAESTKIEVRLTPPVQTGKLVEHFELNVDAATQTDPVALMLSEPAVIHGTVKQPGGAGGLSQSMPGLLEAIAQSNVPGRELRYTAISHSAEQVFGDGQVAGFELLVQPGHTYELIFRPDADANFPPHRSKITVSGSVDKWKIELPTEDKLVSVTGAIVAAGKPLANLRVYLADNDGQLSSTRGTTDAAGKFLLRVDPMIAAGKLRFEPIDAAVGLPKGWLETPVEIHKASRKDKPAPLELGDLDVGAMPAPESVTVIVQSAESTPELGAMVQLQRPLNPTTPGLNAVVQSQGVTDEQGRFSALVPPGAGGLWVMPGPTSVVGRWSAKTELKAGKVVVACPARAWLSGTAVDYQNRPIKGAKVWLRRVAQASPLADTQVVTGALGDLPIEVSTDGAGKFKMPVDPGGWWLWLLPKSSDLLPRVLAAKVDIADKPVQVDVTVPAPLLLIGKVVTAKGGAVSHASIDILAPKVQEPTVQRGEPGGKGPNSAGAGVVSDSHLLGTTVTDSQGGFEVLIAPGK